MKITLSRGPLQTTDYKLHIKRPRRTAFAIGLKYIEDRIESGEVELNMWDALHKFVRYRQKKSRRSIRRARGELVRERRRKNAKENNS